MKSFKLFIGSVIAIVCLVVSGGVFTSCTNDDDQLLAGDSQTEQLSSAAQNMTRSAVSETTSLGTKYISSNSGYVDETSYTFTLTAPSTSNLNNSRVRVYILFYAPYGGTYPNEMTKSTLSNGNIQFLLVKSTLSQYGTYTVRFVYTIDNADPTTNSTIIGGSHTIFSDCRVISSTNNYYWKTSGTSDVDLYGFYCRWCTSWVAQKVNENWGTTKNFKNTMFGESNKLGNASNWLSVLTAHGYSADLHPKSGDIAYWSSNHVAFVNEVISEDEVFITEYNYYHDNQFNSRYLYRNGGTGHKFPTQFIHVQSEL